MPVSWASGDEKEQLVKKLGAEKWIDFKRSPGLGPHAAVVASAGGAAYEQAVEYIRPHGPCVAVGLPPGCHIKVNVFFAVILQKKVVGSYVGNRQDATEASTLAAAGKVKCLYKTLPASDLPKVYDDMHHGKITGRIVLDMNKF
ncbi:MAG: Alcohol dehydrogenase [Cyphobasidiales sp. Tagirdzhanova-0007]|nr:MAG: Alcohol dehydrogenase [Cyphobasidiales sp. Tagirdzhanova-0007]